jgi:hypothetical protein
MNTQKTFVKEVSLVGERHDDSTISLAKSPISTQLSGEKPNMHSP